MAEKIKHPELAPLMRLRLRRASNQHRPQSRTAASVLPTMMLAISGGLSSTERLAPPELPRTAVTGVAGELVVEVVETVPAASWAARLME